MLVMFRKLIAIFNPLNTLDWTESASFCWVDCYKGLAMGKGGKKGRKQRNQGGDRQNVKRKNNNKQGKWGFQVAHRPRG